MGKVVFYNHFALPAHLFTVLNFNIIYIRTHILIQLIDMKR